MAEDLQGTLATIPGLRTYLGTGEYLRARDERQRLSDILAKGGEPDEVIRNLSMAGPSGVVLAQHLVNLAKEQAAISDARRQAAVRKPEFVSRFLTPGAPAEDAIAQPPEEVGGGPGRPAIPAKAPGFDEQGYLNAAAAAGAVDPVTLAKERIAERQPKFAPTGSPRYAIGSTVVETPGGDAAGTPEVVRLNNFLQSLPEGHPARQSIQDRIDKLTTTNEPFSGHVVKDETSPTGWSWADIRTGQISMKGAPPPNASLNLAGGRESVYISRMIQSANQGAKDLANVVQLPLTASTGVFGGRKQGPGLLDATSEVLANKVTGQEAQAYNAMATGFQRSLAQIEAVGLMPSGSLTHQMDAVLFKEGDTNLTKLHKLAQTRQIIESGMEVIDANPRVSPQEKAKAAAIVDSIKKSVPFTHSDLIKLQLAQQANPNTTLGDVIKAKRASSSAIMDQADAILNGGR